MPKRRSDGSAWVVVIIAVALFFGFRPFHFSRMFTSLIGRSNATRREFNLASDKASMVFDLLAPEKVKVVVGRRPNGVSINGTSDEVATLNDFVTLLTRYESEPSVAAVAAIERLSGRNADKRLYHLPVQQAASLIGLLAAKDVPVLVSGGGGEVNVIASAADQRVIHDVVQILLGRR